MLFEAEWSTKRRRVMNVMIAEGNAPWSDSASDRHIASPEGISCIALDVRQSHWSIEVNDHQILRCLSSITRVRTEDIIDFARRTHSGRPGQSKSS